MRIIVKNHDKLTPKERRATQGLRLSYGEIFHYYSQAKDNIKRSPALNKCTKIILAKHGHKVIGWALYTPQASSYRDLCSDCSRYKKYYFQVYVARDYRRQGVGRAILNEAKKRAKRLKHQIVVFPHDDASDCFFHDPQLVIHPDYERFDSYIV